MNTLHGTPVAHDESTMDNVVYIFQVQSVLIDAMTASTAAETRSTVLHGATRAYPDRWCDLASPLPAQIVHA